MQGLELQVKSIERVEKHGEVFTSQKEVIAMCDLVKQETERIESRFLEPACGTGNFLAEVLKRKLEKVTKRYKRSQLEFEKYSLTALMSLYGVDILSDNVKECQDRLFDIWYKNYHALYGNGVDLDCIKSAKFVLKMNILAGDALTMEMLDGRPIKFSEWSFVIGDNIKRRVFTFNELLKPKSYEVDLFSDEEDVKKSSIAKPEKVYPITSFRKVYLYE